jgi:hypothetical protein
MSWPKPRKWRLYFYAAATFILLCLMYAAGLWPFAFCAPDNAVISANGEGITFSSPAVAYDIDTFTTSEKSFLADSVVTIHLNIRPGGASARPQHRPAWLVSLRHGHRERPLIGQWKSHLLVQTIRSTANAGFPEKKELSIRDAFLQEKNLAITIVTGPPGTALYMDGERKAFAKGYQMFDRRETGPQHLQLGGSIIGKYTWPGTVYEFGVYKGDVSDQPPGTRYASGGQNRTSPEASGVLMRFVFDKPGALVPSRDGGRHALRVPPRFPVSFDQVLVPIWDDFTNNKEYYADIAVNFIGFIPIGYMIAGFFMLLFPKRRRNAFLIAFFGGFCLSLSIELLQALLPLRSSQMSDLIFNSLGTVAGAWAGVKTLNPVSVRR